jgi:protein-tyrosine phosphatase
MPLLIFIMYWITEKLGTASMEEKPYIKRDESIKIVKVTDLVDGVQTNKGQLPSKVDKVEKLIKEGNKVIVICTGGISRSNGVALAYLVKTGMDFNEALDLVEKKVPIAQIVMDIRDFIKEHYVK